MKLRISFLILTTASSVFAGRFEVVGEGTATVPSEYVQLAITARSECHNSALSALQTVDELTERALLALKPFTADIPQQLQVAPEANLQAIKTAYIGNQTVTICDEDHSWNSATSIRFRLNDLKKLASLQDALLILNPAKIPNTVINVERLSLTIAKPTNGVLADTWDTMSDLALQRAQQNALRQVKVLTQGMNQSSLELVKVQATTNSSGQAIYDRVDSEGDTSGIGLGFVSLKIARQFTYKVGP